MLKMPWRATSLLGAGLLLSVFSATPAQAYPEMVRHGYTNCTACHLSPTGGGLLNFYGRELSREVLSAWGQGEEGTRESNFVYMKEKLPEWLNLGGEVRTVELYQDTSAFRRGKFMLMQADLAGAVLAGNWTFAASIGLQGEAKRYQPDASEFLSRSHYAQYRLNEEIAFRAGRFFPAYGINTADHVTSIKRNLKMGQPGGESYNLEASYLGERWNGILTGILGQPDVSESRREKGFAAQGAFAVSEKSKIGWSFLHASTPTATRNVTGPFAILGFTPHFFLLSELDLEMESSGNEVVTYNRLNYEFIQGIHGYLTHEILGLDPSLWGTQSQMYGWGFQFFPRPHFEVNLSWQMKRSPVVPGTDNYAWLLFHFYL